MGRARFDLDNDAVALAGRVGDPKTNNLRPPPPFVNIEGATAKLDIADWRSGEGFSLAVNLTNSSGLSTDISVEVEEARSVTVGVESRDDETGEVEGAGNVRVTLCCTPSHIFDIFTADEKVEVEVSLASDRPQLYVLANLNH